jgi:diguanylate cyclase (GGDEF)-like protein
VPEVVPEPGVPWAALEALLELTERALSRGLDAAVAEAVVACRDAGLDIDTGPAARALASAVASAERTLAVRDTDSAGVDELREQARLDDLTGALNRRAFFARLDDELARARPAGTPVTLVLYDLDGFKRINDEHGHPTGDTALRAFAQGLEANLRASDSVGRIGGDEFALVLIGADPVSEARILARLATTLASGGPGTTEVLASFGAARFPDDGVSRDDLVATADRRLYEHKRRP